MRATFGADRDGAFVSLGDRGRVLHTERGDVRGDLLRLFDAVLRQAAVKTDDVDEVCVDRGPAGFSVVRRRVATATALAAGLGAALAATGPLSPEQAAALPSSSFRKGADVAPLYDGEPNITAPKRKTSV